MFVPINQTERIMIAILEELKKINEQKKEVVNTPKPIRKKKVVKNESNN